VDLDLNVFFDSPLDLGAVLVGYLVEASPQESKQNAFGQLHFGHADVGFESGFEYVRSDVVQLVVDFAGHLKSFEVELVVFAVLFVGAHVVEGVEHVEHGEVVARRVHLLASGHFGFVLLVQLLRPDEHTVHVHQRQYFAHFV